MAENEAHSEQTDVLKTLGLTEYEAKAYLTLLKYGTLTAEKISELGRIPLPRVYDTISELQKKGFVLVGQTRPKRFKPVSPDRAIGMFMEYRRKQTAGELENIKGRAQDAVKALKGVESAVVQQEGFNVWSMERRGNLTKFLMENEKRAKEEVLSFSGDMSWIRELGPTLKDAIRRGVKVKILVHDPKGQKNVLENVKIAKKIGCDVRTGFGGMLRGQLVDGKIALLATKMTEKGVNPIESGEPGTDANKKYELMIMDNPAVVRTFREYFFFWWKEAAKK
jgi:sugar-specific transcriptional regulator TrmB